MMRKQIMTRNEAISRAWAATDWGVSIEHIESALDGYMEDADTFAAHLKECGFEIVVLIEHEGEVS